MTSNSRLSKANGADDVCLSRRQTAARLNCHIETLKRREKQGKLHPLHFSSRMVRYRLSEILALEHEAEVNCRDADPLQARAGVRLAGRLGKQKQTRKLSTEQPSPGMESRGVVAELDR